MAKLTLPDVGNILGNPTSAQSRINSNSTLIETALENTLSRDGTSPNRMGADIDMDHNDILNINIIQSDDFIIGGSTVTGALQLAQDSANAAAASAVKASQWAANPEDVAVEPGEFSALHWATKASEVLPQMQLQLEEAIEDLTLQTEAIRDASQGFADDAEASATEAAMYAVMIGAAVYDFNFDTDPSTPGLDWNE